MEGEGLSGGGDAQRAGVVLRMPSLLGDSCPCGCGLRPAKGRVFMSGHDARFATYIQKLDTGLVVLDDLPERVRILVEEKDPLV